MTLLKDIILILSFAIVLILALSKLRIPPVIGFLVTGVMIGPSALQMVQSVSEIEVLAEIGVILLMFSIGLEFSFDKIKRMFRDVFLFGGLQVAASWLAFSIILYWFGLETVQALLGGFMLALSSTAIVLKLLQDNDDLGSLSGLKMTGILLFQDAAIIPAMIILSNALRLQSSKVIPAAVELLIAIGSVIVIYFCSKLVLPKLISAMQTLRVQDLLPVAVFVILFGVAIIAHKVGISWAMGAFIVGIAISDSDFSHQIITDIIPSKHIFNSIFFISIGMFVDISFVVSHWAEIAILTLVIVFVKALIILAIFSIGRLPLNVAIFAALGLAHTGEFSFILLRMAQEHSLFSSDTYQVLLSSAIVTMFFIPFFLKLGKKISTVEKLTIPIDEPVAITPLANHTIIAGYGASGQNVSKVLKLLGIPYLIVEMNSASVKKFKSKGEPIYFGSIDRQANLNLVNISGALALIIAINDINAASRAVTIAKKMNPAIKIIVRVNYLSQVETLYGYGADLVLAQEMETSLTLVHHILKLYNMPDHVSRIQTNLLRKEHYNFFVKEKARESWKIAILDAIEQDQELFFISPHSKHVSKRLADLEPFKYQGVEIIGLIRKNQILTQRLAEIVIDQFDTIIFSGNHKKVSEALNWMEANN